MKGCFQKVVLHRLQCNLASVFFLFPFLVKPFSFVSNVHICLFSLIDEQADYLGPTQVALTGLLPLYWPNVISLSQPVVVQKGLLWVLFELV